MVHEHPRIAVDALNVTFRLYRCHFAAFVRNVVSALLPFLLFWVLLAADVFIQFVGALDLGDPLRELLPVYGTSMVFFFVLHLLVTNNVVQLAPRLVIDADAVPSQLVLGTNQSVLLLSAVLVFLPIHLLGAIVADQLALTPPFLAALLRHNLTHGVSSSLAVTMLPPLLFGVLMVGVVARLQLAPQAVLVENSGPFGCFRRSWQLTSGHGTQTWAALALLELLVGVVVELPIVGVALVVLLGTGPQFLVELATAAAIISQALYIVLLPLPFIATTVLYADVRY